MRGAAPPQIFYGVISPKPQRSSARDSSRLLRKVTPFPVRANTPMPVRLASVWFCWLRFCSVWAGYSVGHADNAPTFTPLTRFPQWWWLSNKIDTSNKPGDGKAPSHLKFIPSGGIGAPPAGLSMPKVFPRGVVLVCLALIRPSVLPNSLQFWGSFKFRDINFSL